ncbi:hypothetical protein [Amnibacterium setariae]|uniref:hypothetical protein n=1 Tax=Amnibacterium setariae TaxID=2306585 RepID=UPI0011C37309|nr:hypothetical protein [Amnibacterium setariae]
MTDTATDVAAVELRLRPDRTDRLEALLVGAGAHLTPVLDVGTAPNGDLVVLVPAPAARLPELLAAPGGLPTGEAVTVLVPLAQSLARLHGAGVAHGGVRADAVLLDAEGSPSWSAPLAPALLRRVGPEAFAARRRDDVAAFRLLGTALLAPTGAPFPEGDDLLALAAALYALAPAVPVRLRRPVEPVLPIGAALPARLVPASPGQHPPGGPGESAALRVRRALGAVRPRAWLALGGAAVLLVVAVVLLPAGAAPAAPAASSPLSARPAPSGTAVRPTATPRAGTTRAAAPRSADVGREVEPAAALDRLLAARDDCLARGSEACLDAVDAPGSPVLAADLAAVRAGTAAARIERRGLRVTEGGGTALGTSGDGTALAVRLPNGWRLRDVVAEPPG